MKRTIIKTCIISTLVLSLSIPALAEIGDSGWYDSNITLPRTGSWSTTIRAATATDQQTQVKSNDYDVLGRITNSGGTSLSDYETHDSGDDTMITHDTGTSSGDKIKAQFKTSSVNYRTTTADLGWRP